MSKYLFNADFRQNEPLSRPKAVYVHCQDCRPEHKPGTCTLDTCELHPWRSEKAERSKSASRTKAIHKYCLGCQGGNRQFIATCDIYDCSLWPYRSKSSTTQCRQIQTIGSSSGQKPLPIPSSRSGEIRVENRQGVCDEPV